MWHEICTLTRCTADNGVGEPLIKDVFVGVQCE